jgi:DNA-binding CsgD family transcriptional regulator
MNLFISITKPYPLYKLLYLTLPYLIVIIMGLFFSFELFLSATLLIVALISIIEKSVEIDYGGSIFFFLSFCVNKNNKYGIFIILITMISISLRSYINDLSIFQSFNLTLAYGAVYSISYLLLIKKSKHLLTKLNKSEYERIKLYSKGMTTEEINDILKLNIDPKNIRQSITKARDKFECSNDIEFTIKLLKMQELSLEEL